jgi:predicted nucleic acid-binding protein
MDRMNLAEFTETEVFVDTNIFIYALAKNHRYKNICVELMSLVNLLQRTAEGCYLSVRTLRFSGSSRK